LHPIQKRLAKPQAFELIWRALCEYSDHWPLLRSLGCCHTRPNECRAEKPEEVSAMHVPSPPLKLK
jgi:hypothetical protein